MAAMLAVTLALGLAQSSRAADATGNAQAQEIVERAGLSEALEGAIRGIVVGIRSAAGQVPEPSQELLIAATSHEFPLRPALDAVIAKVAELPADQRAAALRWYRSSLGARITAIEVAAADQDDLMAAQMAQVTAHPPTEVRAALVAQLLQATRARDLMRTLLESTITSVALGAMSSQPKELRPPLKQLGADLAPLIEQSLAQMDQLMFVSGAATYAALSDAELEQYIHFLGAPAGTAVNEIAMKAITAATSAYVYTFGKAVATASEGLHAL